MNIPVMAFHVPANGEQNEVYIYLSSSVQNLTCFGPLLQCLVP